MNSPPLTELCVMTRIRLARTADKLAIVNMIVPRSRTSPPTSSAVSVVTQVTWLETVPTDREVPVGAMMVLWEAALLDVLAVEKPWIRSMR